MKLIECNKGDLVLVQIGAGETLQDIIMRYSIDSNDIIRNNSQIELYEGEVVQIVRQTTMVHIVKPMETLEVIANKYNIKVEDLIKINDLKSNRLFIGQSLKIEDKSK